MTMFWMRSCRSIFLETRITLFSNGGLLAVKITLDQPYFDALADGLDPEKDGRDLLQG